MGKLLLLLLIAAVAWAFFKKQQRPDRPAAGKSGEAKPAAAERMVACASCGVYMPESDSVLKDGKIGCRDPAHCAHRPS
ncbi:MAG TPA: PP0621 family protein [Usitatibacteraceae bacterium]